jgi:phage terminase small subunit
MVRQSRKGIKNRKSTLTPAKKAFAIEYAKTDNGTQSVLKAFDNNYTPQTARVKATRLLANDNVLNEIEYQKNKLEKLASKAVDRLDNLIQSDNETIATTNIWNTIHQVQGKPLAKNLNMNVSVSVEDMLNSLQ